jgi:uncharacterized membrane protein YfcA
MWRCFDDVCEHKELFPLNYSDLFLMLLIFGTTMLSTLSGVGGGAIDVLILMLVGGFPLEAAVPLALCDVFGACIVKFGYFVKRRNPLNNFRYLPNYKIVLLFVPLYGTFAYIGYLLNSYSPYFLTLLVLFVVLCVSLYKSLVKLIVLYRNNSAFYVKERAEIDGIYDVLVEKESIASEQKITLYMDYAQVNVSKYELELYGINRRREKLFGLLFVNALCIALNLVLLIFTFLKLIDPVLFFGIQLLFTVCVVFFVVCYIYVDNGVGNGSMDTIVWSWFNILKLIIASSVTGIVSSYVGIGGGMIMNPILVSMKVSPHVVLATYSVSAFYSVTIAIFQYIILGNISLFYSFLFFFCGICGALCGVFLLHFMNSQKAIIWCMIILFLLSIIMVFVSFFLELQDLQDLQDLQEIRWNIGILSS